MAAWGTPASITRSPKARGRQPVNSGCQSPNTYPEYTANLPGCPEQGKQNDDENLRRSTHPHAAATCYSKMSSDKTSDNSSMAKCRLLSPRIGSISFSETRNSEKGESARNQRSNPNHPTRGRPIRS